MENAAFRHRLERINASVAASADLLRQGTQSLASCVSVSPAVISAREAAHSELTTQIGVCSALVEELKSQHESLAAFIDSSKTRDEATLHALDNALTSLASLRIDPPIEGIQEGTLFDFVDTEAVGLLTAQAKDSLGELATTKNRSEQLLAQAQQSLDGMVARLGRASCSPVEAPDHSNLIQILRQSSEEATHSESRAVAAMTIRSTPEEALNALLICDQEVETCDQLLAVAKSASVDLMRGVAHCDEMQRKRKEESKEAEALVEDLEQQAGSLKAALIEVSVLLSETEKCDDTSRLVFEEVANLTAWYHRFEVAYGEIPNELNRRSRESVLRKSIVAAMNGLMKEMWKEEEVKRAIWVEMYGRFLPPSLCPQGVNECVVIKP